MIYKIQNRSIILFVLFVIYYTLLNPLLSQDTVRTKFVLRSIAEGVLKDATFKFIDQKSYKLYSNPEESPRGSDLKIESSYNDWRYWNGVLNIAMLRLSEALKEPSYSEFVKKNIDFSFQYSDYFKKFYNNEDKWSFPFAQKFIMEELDDYGAMGASVIEVFKLDPLEKYKEYINKAKNQISKKQGHLSDNTFIRAFPRKYTLWADDLYMSISLLSRMGELLHDKRIFDLAIQQVINYHKYLFNEEKGIMYHCWYSDIRKNGTAYWGRANGWAMLAQIDLLDKLPSKHPKRKILIDLFIEHLIGIARYQSSSGLWHQLLDKNDSYQETSCSAMFTYAVSRAVNKGYIDPRYITIAKCGWEGIMKMVLPDGKIQNVCTGTVVSDDLPYYYERPKPLNDIHGVGFVLLAGIEMLYCK